jgi:uncharacterized protein
MPKKLLKRFLPDQASIQRFPAAQRFAPFLIRPELWAINRKSVAAGLAVGLFAGMIPGPTQILCAMAIAIFLRVNLPVAVLGTLLTNPFTLVPIWIGAYHLGSMILGTNGSGAGAQFVAMPASDWSHPLDMVSNWVTWLGQLGEPLLLGMGLLTIIIPTLGYCGVHVIWRAHVAYTVRARRHQQKQTPPSE